MRGGIKLRKLRRIIGFIIAAAAVVILLVICNSFVALASTSNYDFVPAGNIAEGAVAYEDDDVVITACQKLSFKIIVGASDKFGLREYAAYLQPNSVNTSLKVDGADTNSYRLEFEITAKNNVTVAIDHKVGSGKTNCILKDVTITGTASDGITPSGTAALVDSKTNDGESSIYETFTLDLKAGETIWFAGQGTNACVYAIDVRAEGENDIIESETETTTENSDISDSYSFTPEENIAEGAVAYEDNNAVISACQNIYYGTLRIIPDQVNGRKYHSYIKTTSVNTKLCTAETGDRAFRLSLEITAKNDVTIVIDHKISAGKGNYILKDVEITGIDSDGVTPSGTATVVEGKENSSESSIYETFKFDLKAGETVWFAGRGTNACIYAIDVIGQNESAAEVINKASSVGSNYKFVPTSSLNSVKTTCQDTNATIAAYQPFAYGSVSGVKYVVGDSAYSESGINRALNVDGAGTKFYRLALGITAKNDITVVIDHKVAAGKVNYLLKDVDFAAGTAKLADSKANDTDLPTYENFTVSLKSGETVWVVGQDSDICISAVDIQS